MHDEYLKFCVGLGVVIFTMLVGSLGAIVGVGVEHDRETAQWRKQCVVHGAAQYVVEDGMPVWKWNNEITH